MKLKRKLLILITMAVLASCAGTRADWGLAFQVNPDDPVTGGTVFLQSSPGYTDGKDSDEIPVYPDYSSPKAPIRIRQEPGVAGWNYEAGWYSVDYRPWLTGHGTLVFGRIRLWANQSYVPNSIHLAYYWFTGLGQQNLPDWVFRLDLLHSPPETGYNGPTSWIIPGSAGKTTPAPIVELPAYRTGDGLTGYEFEFRASAVPEPASLSSLAAFSALAFAFRRRKTGGG